MINGNFAKLQEARYFMEKNQKHTTSETVMPDESAKTGKKEQVAQMFDDISSHYDFLNHFLSLGIDIRWRKKLIRKMLKESPRHVLDVATGTGDLAIMAAKGKKFTPESITGIDISEGMLDIGRKKLKDQGLSDKITLEYGDSENMPFKDNTFDAVSVAFGVRNFENLEKGIKELNRVTAKDGKLYILEFSQPKRFPFKHLYNFYFNYVLPFIGRTVSKHKKAYSYLPESVSAFPSGNEFAEKLKKAGFREVTCKNLTFGISTLYTATK